MRKSVLIIFCILLSALIVSCDENQQLIINQTTPTPTIRGTVSIPEGIGLSGNDFYVRIMEGEKAVFTGKVNADGSFAVSGLSEEATYSILLTTEEPGDIKGSKGISKVVSTSGYGGWLSNVTASINEQAGVGSIKVKPLGTIKGIVTKDKAEDNYDTTVYIPGTSYLAMTDGDGNYSIFNVPQATYTLRFISSGYMAKMVSDIVLYSDSDTENPVKEVEPQILIKNAGNLVGTISKIGVTDHSNITVMLSDGENVYTGSTATDGSLMITGITPGTYVATISTSGFMTQTVEEIKIEAAKNTTLNSITLTANGGTISGSVSMNDGGDNAGVSILATSSDEKYIYTGLTDINGYFSLTNIYPGTYALTFNKVGYASSSIGDIVSTAGQANNVGNIILASRYGSVSGIVTLAESAENSGITVTLIYVADTSIKPTTISAADGTYTFSNLTNAGQYTITFSKDGYVSDTGKILNVTLGQNTTIEDVTLRSLTSTVTGKVTLEGTEDFTGISVLLKTNDNSRQYNATTDQQGNFTLSKVNPGEYLFYVSKPGYETFVLDSITVESSITKKLETRTLSIATRSIVGSVMLELSDDNAGALVTATNLANSKLQYSAISNSEGNYTLAEMQPGEYRIVITDVGYRTATLPTVSVVANSTADMGNTKLEINRGTIYGKVSLEGRTSNTGVKVELMRGTEEYATEYTNEFGEYSFYVPQGNYSGVRFSKVDFKSESDQNLIALFADNFINVSDVELEATHNTVKGIVDVFKGLEDVENSNVTLSFDNYNQAEPVITGESGAFQFEHVPVSDSFYYLRIERENCSSIVLQVKVEAADEINLGLISMYSNTGTIKGQAVLDDEYDSSGIQVSVDTGKGILSTLTDATGRYELGGIPAGQALTVIYSKIGWDTSTVQIDPVLEALEVRLMESIILPDSIAPTLDSIVINSGNNTATSRTVNVQINATDAGSGISLMQYSWTGDFSMSEWKNYEANKSLVIPSEDNGQKTLMLRVRDKLGNLSEIKTDSIELVDQIKVYHGTLSGEDLNWTQEKSPIVVTGDLYVPIGKTLVIDSGVDVYFDGYYSINLDGYIQAIGSETDHIVIKSTNDYVSDVLEREGYYGEWGGINAGDKPLNVNNNNGKIILELGSILSYVDVQNMRDGISGCIMIEECTIQSSYCAVADFYGSIINSSFTGDVSFGGKSNNTKRQYIMGNHFSSLPNRYCSFIFNPNPLNNYTLMNNYFYHMYTYFSGDITSCTFDNCDFQYSALMGVISDCLIINSPNTARFFTGNGIKLVFSNLIGNSAEYVIHTDSLETMCDSKTVLDLYDSRFDLRFNYWGEAYSKELLENKKYGYQNHSFIFDYYDDYRYRKADLSEFQLTPWPSAGFKGKNLVAFEAKSSDYRDGWDGVINVSMITDGEIKYYRTSQSLTGLLESEWISYSGECIVPLETIDQSLITPSGCLDILVQCKTESIEMPIRIVSVPFGSPKLIYQTLEDGYVFNSDSIERFYFYSIYSLFTRDSVGYFTGTVFYTEDDEAICDRGDYAHSNGLYRQFFDFDPTRMANGQHEFRYGTYFVNSNIVENWETIKFYVERPVPTCTSISILNENCAVPADGGSLQLEIPIENTKHLKTLKVKSGETVLFTKEYDDYKVNTMEETISVDCSSLSSGEHTVQIELEDYTGNITKLNSDTFTVE